MVGEFREGRPYFQPVNGEDVGVGHRRPARVNIVDLSLQVILEVPGEPLRLQRVVAKSSSQEKQRMQSRGRRSDSREMRTASQMPRKENGQLC